MKRLQLTKENVRTLVVRSHVRTGLYTDPGKGGRGTLVMGGCTAARTMEAEGNRFCTVPTV